MGHFHSFSSFILGCGSMTQPNDQDVIKRKRSTDSNASSNGGGGTQTPEPDVAQVQDEKTESKDIKSGAFTNKIDTSVSQLFLRQSYVIRMTSPGEEGHQKVCEFSFPEARCQMTLTRCIESNSFHYVPVLKVKCWFR